MSDVFNRTTGQFLQSVNTPDFDVADWIINPDLSAVIGEPVRYWLIVPANSDTIILANAGQQQGIDNAIAAQRRTRQKDEAKNSLDDDVIAGITAALPPEFNVLRTIHGLPDLTPAQLKTAIEDAIDAAP